MLATCIIILVQSYQLSGQINIHAMTLTAIVKLLFNICVGVELGMVQRQRKFFPVSQSVV